jgi:hypothetical protein
VKLVRDRSEYYSFQDFEKLTSEKGKVGADLPVARLLVRPEHVFHRLTRTKWLHPEDRILSMMLGSIFLPIGLLWFPWKSSPIIPWPAQAVSSIFIGRRIILIFMADIMYLVDVYLLNAVTVITVNTFICSALAASFPLFATYMYAGMGDKSPRIHLHRPHPLPSSLLLVWQA